MVDDKMNDFPHENHVNSTIPTYLIVFEWENHYISNRIQISMIEKIHNLSLKFHLKSQWNIDDEYWQKILTWKWNKHLIVNVKTIHYKRFSKLFPIKRGMFCAWKRNKFGTLCYIKAVTNLGNKIRDFLFGTKNIFFLKKNTLAIIYL